eukprot:CAMPEP_0201488474 /NCGR_PEP_ID=MMETSP0151_2-20130828/18468_1 /ASSEMBLY_ACC=CAM_ASM_000257 /TAXON_ID=200890 /ORGANISM="Paramoeba atlantica, Strain 621/1 / CCAP 1560/9" /LENGTH=257 /DNA_ID=CAMNT_0047873773 /DNA_START=100 /DNA_END=873 /DNA_ORIENTATION=-
MNNFLNPFLSHQVVMHHKGRPTLDIQQIRAMEWVYNNRSRYISGPLKEKLAETLGLTLSQIGKWFETRRLRGPPVQLSKHPVENPIEWERMVEELKIITTTYPLSQLQEKLVKQRKFQEKVTYQNGKRKRDSMEQPSPDSSPMMIDERSEKRYCNRDDQFQFTDSPRAENPPPTEKCCDQTFLPVDVLPFPSPKDLVMKTSPLCSLSALFPEDLVVSSSGHMITLPPVTTFFSLVEESPTRESPPLASSTGLFGRFS